MVNSYHIHPVGIIHNREGDVRIEIYPAYTKALLGLNQFSHIQVLYWLHVNDTPEKRKTLQVHPRKNSDNPLTGVFATHSPRRPNPIALSRCRILAVTAAGIDIDDIDALDGSPVIDIKAFFPHDPDDTPVIFPDWK
jgi:tRNA-Thr(GGU) m(6)t(6)A37 methyltransferase TsaA